MTFLEILEKRIRQDEVRLAELLKEIKELPSGNLVRRDKKNSKEYYRSIKGRETYIKKQDWEVVNGLKRRKLLEMAADRLQNNIEIQRKLYNEYVEIDFGQLEQELPETYRDLELILPKFKIGQHISEPDGSQFFRQSENQYKREELVNSTYFGLKTRSKSEAMIAETLYRNKFSLYYEKRLLLVDAFGNPRTVYPDFTIPIGRNHVVYWEHKGLLDSDEYLLRDAEKTRLYHINGIYQPKKLIVTAEKPGGGLDNEYVEYLVGGFLEHVRKNLVYI